MGNSTGIFFKAFSHGEIFLRHLDDVEQSDFVSCTAKPDAALRRAPIDQADLVKGCGS